MKMTNDMDNEHSIQRREVVGIMALTLMMVLGWLSYRFYRHEAIPLPVAATDTLPPRGVISDDRAPSVERINHILNIAPQDTSCLTR